MKDEDARALYASIVRQNKKKSRPLPTPGTHIIRFEDTLLRMVNFINRRRGWEYMTLRYEGQWRWTMMGHHPSDWMQFEYVDAMRFIITRLLPLQPGCLRSFRCGGIDMYGDIRDALRFYGQDPERCGEGCTSPGVLL